MAREIKFRVWGGLMLDHDYLIQSDYLVDAINGKYPIMQFTGLKDKNGVDIYEGDIIKHNDYSNGAYLTSTQPQRSSIVSLSDLFNGCKLPGLGYDVTQKQLSFIEIIGNIHENPELLNQ